MERLTALDGREAYPSISPDGVAVVFANRGSGHWDIYTQRRLDEPPRNPTAGSRVDDTQPSFSRDGRWIAFRSERDGGGIFVMDADGTKVRKLCARGFHPVWSPDGCQIAYAGFLRMRATEYLRRSQIEVLDVSSGQQRAVTSEDVLYDGAQPVWSPDGQWLAFWGTDKLGVTYVYTALAGGKSVPVKVVRGGPVKSVQG